MVGRLPASLRIAGVVVVREVRMAASRSRSFVAQTLLVVGVLMAAQGALRARS